MQDQTTLRFTPFPLRGLVLPCLLAGAFLTGGCATFSGTVGPSLRDELDAVITSPPLDQVSWGIRIVDPERGQVLYSQNGHRKFIPASNMKILATSAALSLLGPEYRYQTELWGVGRVEPESGTFDGDLVLRATGDPTLSERFYPSAQAPLDSLAQGLWAAGIRSVTGSLVVDVSAWDSTSVPGTWMVGDLPGTSGATGGAFAIAEGLMTIEVIGGETEGAPAQARWWPENDPDFITVAYLTVHPDSSTRGRRTSYLPESRRLRVEGRVRAGEVDTLRTSQREPVRVASAALLRALERRGIEVRGGL
ncbi:D-alanyl-D-alanine carboxypeptidase, partial [Gemmatimonadota bacterium]